MAHKNVAEWRKNGEQGVRPCDWCGCPLEKHKYIHQKCTKCGRSCYREEEKFYTALGFDGEPPSDVTLPGGYEIRIPPRSQ